MTAIRLPGLGDCVTAQDAADILSVSRARVHQAVKDGVLRGAKLGAMALVSLASVHRYKRTRKPGRPKNSSK